MKTSRSRMICLWMLLALVVGARAQSLLAGGDIRIRSSGIKVGTPPAVATPRALSTPPAQTVTPAAPQAVNPPPSLPPAAPPAPLGPGPVQLAQLACTNMQDLIDQGQLGAQFVGLGQVAGDMVDMILVNKTSQEMELNFVPGMVLEPPLDSGTQDIMVEQEHTYVLPAGGTLTRRLACYCLDFPLDPPEKGNTVLFRFSRQVETHWSKPVKVLVAGLGLESHNKYEPIIEPLQHRRIVIQRAIWHVLGQIQDRQALDSVARRDSGVAEPVRDKVVNSLVRDMSATLKAAEAIH